MTAPARSHILGLGTAQPAAQVTQQEAADIAAQRCTFNADQADWLARRYQHSHVDQRGTVVARSNGQPAQHDAHRSHHHAHASAAPAVEHACLEAFYPPARDAADRGPTTAARMARYALEAPPLAADAARRALDDADLQPHDITHLVTVSCTGFNAPGVDVAVIQQLRLRDDVQRTMVGFMGCHGAFNGVKVADAIARSDPAARILVLCVELCSLHFQYGYDPGAIVANALFADGAAALVIAADPALVNPDQHWSLRAATSRLLPDSADDMQWTIGDHGFAMTLDPRIPRLIRNHLPAFVHAWLREHRLTSDRIRTWALHPGGPKILDAVTAALGLPDDADHASRHILRTCGNMSSATVPFVINQLRQRPNALPCLALGFGPGITIEAALFT